MSVKLNDSMHCPCRSYNFHPISPAKYVDDLSLQVNEELSKDILPSKPGIGIRHLQAMMMCLCITTLYIIRGSISIAILAMTDSTSTQTYPWNKRIQGAVLSAFFWGYMIMQIPSGVIAKRFGGKPLLLGALLLNGVLCFSVPIIVTFGGWRAVCAAQAGIGLAQGALFPAIHTLLGRWIPEEERTRLSNHVYSGVQIGTIISMPASGLLAKTSLGWKNIFFTMGIIGILMTIFWWHFTASCPSKHKMIGAKELAYIESSLKLQNFEKDSINHIPWMKFVKSVPVFALTIAHIGVNWTFVIFFVELPSYMKHVLGVNLGQGAWLSTLPFMAMWFNQFLSGLACEYITNNNLLSLTTSRKLFNSIASFGVAIGLVILSFLTAKHKVLAITVLTLTVGLQASSFSGFLLNHIDLSPNYAGILLGITNCLSNIIGALAPISTGLIVGKEESDPTRWRWVFFLAAVIISLANIVYLIFGISERQPWDEPTLSNLEEDLELLRPKSRSYSRVN